MARIPESTYVTTQQAVIHALFVKHRSMSVVGRALGITMIRVREALVQHERNVMRDAGMKVPPLREMLKGDVTTRFGVSRKEAGGRPAKYKQHGSYSTKIAPTGSDRDGSPMISIPAYGVSRLIVTSVEPDARVHGGFWRNLKAYASACGAGLAVARVGWVSPKRPVRGDHADHIANEQFGIDGLLDVALDERVLPRLTRPLETVRHRSSACWTIIVHPAVQFETLPRLRVDGYKAQLTTGAMTVPLNRTTPGRRELGAVIIEVTAGGLVYCRHILADVDGDGSFHDLDVHVSNGSVQRGCRVEALTFGDIHHAHLDPAVAAATWGSSEERPIQSVSLVDRLRPKYMVFHDVCDFDARNHHDRKDHHRRFAQMVAGGGDVRAELTATADFLRKTRREWAQSIVVGSNHDGALERWLAEADFREDPENAIMFLECSMELHKRLAAGRSIDGFFEQTLRTMSADGLVGVRFLQTGESLRIAGIETGIHGHLGADGRQGDVRFFERLAIKATLGHTHRPTSRDGIYCSGVCQSELRYARGPVTAWGVGHVVTYPNGTRQHLIFIGNAFHG